MGDFAYAGQPDHLRRRGTLKIHHLEDDFDLDLTLEGLNSLLCWVI